MKHIFPALIAIVCIVAGSIGGHFLKSRPGKQAGTDSHVEAADAQPHGEKEEAHAPQAPAKENQGSASHGSSSSADIVYYKFSREFIVPILQDNSVKSLVILNLNLEAESGLSQKLYSMEPKLRDNIMTTLIRLSNDGVTFESLTDVDSYESIRATILENLKNVIPSGIRNVLILDIARQDM